MKQLTDTSERDQLILEHLGLARAISMDLYRRMPSFVDLDDVIHTGVLGLVDAATKYRTDRHVCFTVYAKFRIRGAILDNMRALDRVPRAVRRAYKKADEAMRELTTTLQRSPTEAEVAEFLNMDVERLRQIRVTCQSAEVISTDFRDAITDDPMVHDAAGSSDTQPDRMSSQVEKRAMLDRAIATLPANHQSVVRSYYAGEMSMDAIARQLGLSVGRISQIHKAALVRMQSALEASGIHSCMAF